MGDRATVEHDPRALVRPGFETGAVVNQQLAHDDGQVLVDLFVGRGDQLEPDLVGIPGLALSSRFPGANRLARIYFPAGIKIPGTLKNQCPHHEQQARNQPENVASHIHEAGDRFVGIV